MGAKPCSRYGCPGQSSTDDLWCTAVCAALDRVMSRVTAHIHHYEHQGNHTKATNLVDDLTMLEGVALSVDAWRLQVTQRMEDNKKRKSIEKNNADVE